MPLKSRVLSLLLKKKKNKHEDYKSHSFSRCRIEDKDTKTGKVAKRKRTTRHKTSKASKCTDKHDNESKYRQLRQAAYKRTFVAFSKSVSCFCFLSYTEMGPFFPL